MKQEDLAKAYAQFFTQTEAGKYFVRQLEETIETQHRLAETVPELSRDYAQTAKGVRGIMDHIESVLMLPKKTKVAGRKEKMGV